MAELILFGFVVFTAITVRTAIIKWRKLDENIDKLVAIEKAQELINKARKEL